MRVEVLIYGKLKAQVRACEVGVFEKALAIKKGDRCRPSLNNQTMLIEHGSLDLLLIQYFYTDLCEINSVVRGIWLFRRAKCLAVDVEGEHAEVVDLAGFVNMAELT